MARAQGKLDTAVEFYLRALVSCSSLFVEVPTDTRWQEDLIEVFRELGESAMKMGEWEVAEGDYRNAIDLATGLREHDVINVVYEAKIASLEERMGEVLVGQRKLLDSTLFFQISILRNEGLTIMSPDVMEWQSNLALSCVQNAKAWGIRAEKNPDVVDSWLKQAREVLRQIDKRSGLYPSERTLLEETQRMIGQN